jgi:hypothetical protein
VVVSRNPHCWKDGVIGGDLCIEGMDWKPSPKSAA